MIYVWDGASKTDLGMNFSNLKNQSFDKSSIFKELLISLLVNLIISLTDVRNIHYKNADINLK